MTVRALMTGDGSTVRGMHIRGKVRRVTHLELPSGGPLTADLRVCHATVKRSRRSTMWWVICKCGERQQEKSWDAAFQRAFRHVTVWRLVIRDNKRYE